MALSGAVIPPPQIPTGPVFCVCPGLDSRPLKVPYRPNRGLGITLIKPNTQLACNSTQLQARRKTEDNQYYSNRTPWTHSGDLLDSQPCFFHRFDLVLKLYIILSLLLSILAVTMLFATPSVAPPRSWSCCRTCFRCRNLFGQLTSSTYRQLCWDFVLSRVVLVRTPRTQLRTLLGHLSNRPLGIT